MNALIDKYQKPAEMLKAIAHPIRMSIITILENKKLSVTEIFNTLEINQATASHHLRILKDKTILDSTRDGKNTYYYLRTNQILKIIDCIKDCCPEI